MIDRRLQILIFVSTLIFLFIIGLYFIRVPIQINARVQATELSFTVVNKTENFLGAAVQTSFKQLEIRNFERLESLYEELATAGKQLSTGHGSVIATSEYANASVMLHGIVSLNDLDLSPGTRVNLKVHRDGKSTVLDISLSGLQSPVTLNNATHWTRLSTVSGILATKEAKQSHELDTTEIEFALPEHGIISVYPDEGTLTLSLYLPENTRLYEEDVISIKGIDFVRRREANNNSGLSSVIEGRIDMRDTERSLIIGRKQKLGFASGDVFEVRDLNIENTSINIIFEGNPKELYVGFSSDNKMPSTLEYLMKNQTLLLLINSYVLVITFFMTLMKLNKGEHDE